MLRRAIEPIRISSIPRNALSVSHHGSIDTALKNLKTSSRRLIVALDVFKDEYRILERLYYKGNNQHRSALFWRRVAEVRRFCLRIDAIHLDQVVNSLRTSFFDADVVRTNPRVMRGSWTHLPVQELVVVVVQRLSACLMLLNKMQERLIESYRTFNLAMQSGAFLQLILTLVAVSSRMRVIAQELLEVVQDILGIARHIAQVLPGNSDVLLAARGEDNDSESTQLHPKATQPLEVTKASMPPNPGVGGASDLVHTGMKLDTPLVPTRIIAKRKDRELQSSVNAGKTKVVNSLRRMKKTRDEIDDIFGF